MERAAEVQGFAFVSRTGFHPLLERVQDSLRSLGTVDEVRTQRFDDAVHFSFVVFVKSDRHERVRKALHKHDLTLVSVEEKGSADAGRH